MSNTPRVAVISGVSAGRVAIGPGIGKFARQNSGWTILTDYQWQITLDDLQTPENFDGFIIPSHCGDERLRLVCASGKPVVCIGPVPCPSGVFRVAPNNQRAGGIAARYFLEQGFKHFAFCGLQETAFSADRREGFQAVLAGAGRTCRVLEMPGPWEIGANAWTRRVQEWVSGLPRPCALFLCMDPLYHCLLQACARLKVRVPEDLSVCGVDDEETICLSASPTLTSISLDMPALAYAACEMLAAIFDGRPPPDRVLWISPMPVVARQSSSRMAVEDEQVAEAIRIIRQRSCGSLCVDDILDKLLISKRSLEMRFKRETGRTVQQEILRMRLANATMLLSETSLSMDDVAHRSGFRSGPRMSGIFRRELNQTPSAYRRQHRRMV